MGCSSSTPVVESATTGRQPVLEEPQLDPGAKRPSPTPAPGPSAQAVAGSAPTTTATERQDLLFAEASTNGAADAGPEARSSSGRKRTTQSTKGANVSAGRLAVPPVASAAAAERAPQVEPQVYAANDADAPTASAAPKGTVFVAPVSASPADDGVLPTRPVEKQVTILDKTTQADVRHSPGTQSSCEMTPSVCHCSFLA